MRLPRASAYFFSPAGGRFGTSLGSYFAPAETWMRVMRTLVGKNFSGSGRVWALAPVPVRITPYRVRPCGRMITLTFSAAPGILHP